MKNKSKSKPEKWLKNSLKQEQVVRSVQIAHNLKKAKEANMSSSSSSKNPKCKGKNTNGKACKNHVSLPGEKFCPAHGGRAKTSIATGTTAKASTKESTKNLRPQQQERSNKKPLPKTPSEQQEQQSNKKPVRRSVPPHLRCEHICTSTKQRCKLQISKATETKCPRHGGLTKQGRLMSAQDKPFHGQLSLQSVCIMHWWNTAHAIALWGNRVPKDNSLDGCKS